MTRAVILAAGEGTRLRPLTERLPKTLVEFNGQAMFDRQTAVLRRAGIDDISVVVGHCAAAFEGMSWRTFFNPHYASTNMVASLHCAKSLFDGSDDVLVSYGDIVYEPHVLEALLACPGDVSVVVDRGWESLWRLRMDDPLADAETLKLRQDGCIAEIGRKPSSLAEIEAQYIGLFKVASSFAPRFFDRYEQWPPERPFEGKTPDKMYMTSYLQLHIDDGIPVRAAPVWHGWLEVDSVEDLRRYEGALSAGRLAVLYDGEV